MTAVADSTTRIQCGVVAAIAVTAILACSETPRDLSRRETGAQLVVCLEYLGETDRPILPFVISDSEASVDAYIRDRAGDRSLAHASVTLTASDGLACIRGSLPALGQQQERSSLLKVRLWTREHGEHCGHLSAPDAAAFLRAARRCLNESSAGSGDVLNILLGLAERPGRQ